MTVRFLLLAMPLNHAVFDIFLAMLHAEATFSVPTIASVEEADSIFMACVTLTTADNVMLDVEVVVELNTVNNTGEFQHSLSDN